jgi:acyl carrier protein
LVPSAFVFLDSLPLTPHGKVDRKALPAPEQSRPELDETFSAPRTAVEGLLAGIWAEVLKIDKVGIHDNFFDLGGHSLLATQVVSRIRRSLRVEVPLRTMFEAPTIAGLAISILKKQAETIDEKNMSRILADIESLSNEEIERQVMDVRK